MQFIYQPLTWGFFLVLVPLLIHLINLLRHRRVQWAAMEFLLQSYRKHRKWVWLKQLLLLLARMLAVAAVVAMLAQLVTRRQWSRFFGGKTTHHIVLLDDSFSMSDRAGGTTAFERAGRAVRQIVNRAGGQETGPQRLTLIRFSRAARTAGLATTAGPAPAEPRGKQDGPADRLASLAADLNADLIDANFQLRLSEKQRGLDVTQLAVGPVPALNLAAQLVEQSAGQQPVVYLVSDFRAGSWEHPRRASQLLERMQQAGAQLHLIRCVDAARPNLAITSLRPAEGTRAAGVPLFVDATVKNFAHDPAEQVQLNIRTTYYPPASATDDPARLKGTVDQLPTVLIDRIGPEDTITRRVQVYFPTAGQHVVEAELPEDAVTVDNRHWSVVDFPADVPVLIVEGDPAQRDAYFLTSVFQPGTRAKTGIRPVVQPPEFLRDVSPEGLREFHAVYLLDVDRLDDVAVANLDQYARSGGGVAIFLGPNTNSKFYNRWYDQGRGLFPAALDRPDVVAHRDGAPDLSVVDHPLFRVLRGQRNPFAQDIRIDQYFRVPAGWRPPEASTIGVLARLGNRQPLVVERRFGQGRVVAVLTTLAPRWNNWARQPSFIVVALQLQAYLDASITRPPRIVGTPVDVQLSESEYRPELRFVVPGAKPGQRRVIQAMASPRGKKKDSKLMTASLGRGAGPDGGPGQTDRSGVYEVWPQPLDARPDVRRYALNVDTRESDLDLVTSEQLADKLQGIPVEIHQPDELSYATAGPSGFSWSQVLLVVLIALLLGEQALAYSASYHPAQGGKR